MGDDVRLDGVVSATTVYDLPPLERREAVRDDAHCDKTIKQRSPFRVSTVKGMPPLTRRPARVRARYGRRYAIVAVIVALASSAALWMLA